MKNVPPIRSADIPDQWIGDVKSVIRRDGRSMRGSPSAPMIELRAQGSHDWAKLMLPGSGFEFVSNEERDLVLDRLK